MCGPSPSHECQRNAAACPGAAEAADVPDAADEPCVLGLAEVVQPAAARAAQEMLSAASGAARRERSLLTQYGIGMETILPDRRHAAADHPRDRDYGQATKTLAPAPAPGPPPALPSGLL